MNRNNQGPNNQNYNNQNYNNQNFDNTQYNNQGTITFLLCTWKNLKKRKKVSFQLS